MLRELLRKCFYITTSGGIEWIYQPGNSVKDVVSEYFENELASYLEDDKKATREDILRQRMGCKMDEKVVEYVKNMSAFWMDWKPNSEPSPDRGLFLVVVMGLDGEPLMQLAKQQRLADSENSWLFLNPIPMRSIVAWCRIGDYQPHMST